MFYHILLAQVVARRTEELRGTTLEPRLLRLPARIWSLPERTAILRHRDRFMVRHPTITSIRRRIDFVILILCPSFIVSVIVGIDRVNFGYTALTLTGSPCHPSRIISPPLVPLFPPCHSRQWSGKTQCRGVCAWETWKNAGGLCIV